MQKAKKFNIEDSNIEFIGSDQDKAARIKAASTEESWKNAGKKTGIEIWRVEQFAVKAWPEKYYGTFFSGDSYIVLKTTKSPQGVFSWNIHFWIGRESSQDEYGTAAYKTVELDDLLGGDPVEYREIQGHESDLFLSYFKQIRILEGGVESGFHHVTEEHARKRLLQVKGRANHVVVYEVPCNRDSLNSGDAFILDLDKVLYQFHGTSAGKMEKNKASEVAHAIANERGNAKVVVVEENDKVEGDAKAFWDGVGGHGKIKTAAQGGDDAKPNFQKKLFRLSDANAQHTLKFTEVPKVHPSSLDSNDVFIFDAGFQVFAWVGKKASKAEKSNALSFATQYLAKYNRPKHLTICRVSEGGESEEFKSAW
jgi:gelsolin